MKVKITSSMKKYQKEKEVTIKDICDAILDGIDSVDKNQLEFLIRSKIFEYLKIKIDNLDVEPLQKDYLVLTIHDVLDKLNSSLITTLQTPSQRRIIVHYLEYELDAKQITINEEEIEYLLERISKLIKYERK